MERWNFVGVALLLALFVNGCSQPAEEPAAEPESPAAEAAEHTHGLGPNGGVVFDLGSHHAEFTVDHDRQQCTILILDADGKSPSPVAASAFTLAIDETTTADGTKVDAMTVQMLPQDAEDGKTAKFVGTDPGIGNVADFAGTVVGEIDGKPASGSFAE